MCASNCPYDAIRMVEIRDTDGTIMADKEMKPILKATKCDLCLGRPQGPACVQSCPHGSAVRISFKDLPTVSRTLSQ